MDERKMIYLDDAINTLERKKDKKANGDIGGFYNKIIQNDIDALMQLPSAQPENRRGQWIYGEEEFGTDGYHCDKCGFFVQWDYVHTFINYIDDYKFCPHCGVDMRKKDDADN